MKNSIKCLFAAMFLISAVSCAKEEFKEQSGGKTVRIITATLANNDSQTKTNLDGNYKTHWSKGDLIWISNGGYRSDKTVQLVTDESELKSGNIRGDMSEDSLSFSFEVPEDWSTVYAVYPYSAKDGVSDGKIKVKIPAVQSGKFEDANICVSTLSGNVLQFRNATAVVKFVQEANANAEIHLSSHTQISGRLETECGSSSLTVTPANPEMTGICASFADDTVSYVAVAPGTVSDLIINVVKSDNSFSKVTVSKKFEVNKVYVTSIKNMPEYQQMTVSDGANCHIIPNGGVFSIDVSKKGNSDTAVGTVASVAVLWESFGTAESPNVSDIISKVELADGKAIITTTGCEGNAVIAAYDGAKGSGNILWSWHIWVCNGYDPTVTKQVYNNSAGAMMDRNLGATSSTPGDVKSLGLMYQWGRKDPFLGASSISSDTRAASTNPYSWRSMDSDDRFGNIPHTVKNPMHFIKRNRSNMDWLWMGTGVKTTENERWKSEKTVYDPCPKGWRVPDGDSTDGIWRKAFNSQSSFKNGPWDDTKKGMNFGSGKSPSLGNYTTIWYPATGYLQYASGGILSVGLYAYYWSCSPSYERPAFDLCITKDADVCPLHWRERAYGLAVRCVQEEQ